ncbi:hypothetical protein BJ085DRAFT_38956 [Dimargaris cristalligena]|uniref:Uncharacterized protein n=1 Tax=Dimargaris cristalligena TaxID=215637 RepID=A0A4P9ZSA9_9FUNG|nr:hypothetical protein BJ085DRAFT_38956 [Dimargaris cristalligena]|eukprot:RKP36078.1 hypothetical protein BJ085DRAFT_38956 [Dimargaris cristalligena]
MGYPPVMNNYGPGSTGGFQPSNANLGPTGPSQNPTAMDPLTPGTAANGVVTNTEPQVIEAEAPLSEIVKAKYDELPVEVKQQAVILTQSAGVSDTTAKAVAVQANDESFKYREVFQTVLDFFSSFKQRFPTAANIIQETLCDFNRAQFKNNGVGYMLGGVVVTQEPLAATDTLGYAMSSSDGSTDTPYSVTYKLPTPDAIGESLQKFMQSAKSTNVIGELIEMKINQKLQQVQMTLSPESGISSSSSSSSSTGTAQTLNRRFIPFAAVAAVVTKAAAALAPKAISAVAPKVAQATVQAGSKVGAKILPQVGAKISQAGTKIAPGLFSKTAVGTGAVGAGAVGAAAVGMGATGAAAVGVGTAAAVGTGAAVSTGMGTAIATTLLTSGIAVMSTQALNAILKTAKTKEEQETRVAILTTTNLMCPKDNV